MPAGDLQLWTERCGRQGRPPIVLIMGTSASAIGWPEELVEALVEGGREVVRFDHRDTGRSSCVDFHRHPYTVADMAADTVAVLDAYGIERAHLVGASLGGTIAQWLAVHRPERVLSLTAMMTGPMGHDDRAAAVRALGGQRPEVGELPAPAPEWLDHLRVMIQAGPVGREQQLALAVRTWRVLNGQELPFDEPAARAYVEAEYERSRNPAAAANHDLAARAMTPDRRVPLSTIAAPTLVIHGTADPLRPLAHGQSVAAQIPNARFQPVQGMGHGFFSPQLPACLARLILDHTTATD